jgi:hypothetical protein
LWDLRGEFAQDSTPRKKKKRRKQKSAASAVQEVHAIAL